MKIQFRKDAGEVNKNDQGETEYIVYQKRGRMARQKFNSKRQKDNENMANRLRSVGSCMREDLLIHLRETIMQIM